MARPWHGVTWAAFVGSVRTPPSIRPEPGETTDELHSHDQNATQHGMQPTGFASLCSARQRLIPTVMPTNSIPETT